MCCEIVFKKNKLTLVFGVLKFRKLRNNEQEVDDGEVW